MQWHALDRSEQSKYYEMAREERAKHMKMYPGWSSRDNYALHKRRKKKKPKQMDRQTDDDSGRFYAFVNDIVMSQQCAAELLLQLF